MGGVDLQLQSLSASALDGGESSALRSGPFNPRANFIPHSIAQGAGWISDPVWSFWRTETLVTCVENRTAVSRLYSPQYSCIVLVPDNVNWA